MLKPKEIQAIRNGAVTADELINSYPVKTLVEDLIALLKTNDTAAVAEPKNKPIALYQEEYDRIVGMFRVKGLTTTGEKSKRGRPSKKNV